MPETSLDTPLEGPRDTAAAPRMPRIPTASSDTVHHDAWKEQVQSRLQEYRQRRALRLGEPEVTPATAEALNIIPFKRRARGFSLESLEAVDPAGVELAEPVVPPARPRSDLEAGGSYQQVIRTELTPLEVLPVEQDRGGDTGSNVRSVSAATAEAVAEAALLAESLAISLGRGAYPLRPMVAAPLPEHEIAEPVLPTVRERYCVPVAAPRAYAAGENPRIEIPLLPAAPTSEDSGSGIELPLPVAAPLQRIVAGCTDAGYVLAACVCFALTSALLLGRPGLDRVSLHRLLPAAVLVPMVFAVLFILAFGHLGQNTPGVSRVGLRICDFDGQPATPAALRRRAWAELISLGALGMGYLWMLVDADHLAWHDHISRTFVADE